MKNIQKKKRNLASTGIFAAIAASLCCITPVFALMVGVSGIATSFSFLEPLRPFFIGIAVLTLGISWYQQLKPQKAVVCDCENNTTSFLQTKKFLFIVTIIAGSLLTFPYYSNIFFPETRSGLAIADSKNIQKVELAIQGMTCVGCESNVNHIVSNIDGVIETNSNYKTGKAVIKYDSTKTSVKNITEKIDETGYKVLRRNE